MIEPVEVLTRRQAGPTTEVPGLGVSIISMRFNEIPALATNSSDKFQGTVLVAT